MGIFSNTNNNKPVIVTRKLTFKKSNYLGEISDAVLYAAIMDACNKNNGVVISTNFRSRWNDFPCNVKVLCTKEDWPAIVMSFLATVGKHVENIKYRA